MARHRTPNAVAHSGTAGHPYAQLAVATSLFFSKSAVIAEPDGKLLIEE